MSAAKPTAKDRRALPSPQKAIKTGAKKGTKVKTASILDRRGDA